MLNFSLMKNFSLVLLFAIMIVTTLNSCVEKCNLIDSSGKSDRI